MTTVDSVDQSLALARAALAPPAKVKGRVRKALMAASPGAGPLLARAGRLAAWKGLSLLGAGLIVGYWLGLERALEFGGPQAPVAVADATAGAAREDAPRAALEAVPEPPSAPPSDAVAAPVDVETNQREVTAPRRRASQSTAPKPSATSRSAAARSAAARTAELLLLARAERAIRAGEGALALALVAELDERHPRSRFGEERSATRVLAECLLHEPPARGRAQAFLEEQPTSVYSERVRTLCGLERAAIDRERSLETGGDGSPEREH